MALAALGAHSSEVRTATIPVARFSWAPSCGGSAFRADALDQIVSVWQADRKKRPERDVTGRQRMVGLPGGRTGNAHLSNSGCRVVILTADPRR